MINNINSLAYFLDVHPAIKAKSYGLLTELVVPRTEIRDFLRSLPAIALYKMIN